MNKFINAKPGFEWAPTDKGMQIGRVTHKYTDEYPNRKQYKKQVPEKWVEEELVVEIPLEK